MDNENTFYMFLLIYLIFLIVFEGFWAKTKNSKGGNDRNIS